MSGSKYAVEETAPKSLNERIDAFLGRHQRHFLLLALAGFVIFLHVWLVLSLIHSVHSAKFLLFAFPLAYVVALYIFVIRPFLERHSAEIDEAEKKWSSFFDVRFGGVAILPPLAAFLLVGGFLAWLVYDSNHNRIRMRSVAGLALYVLIGFLCSANPAKIKWRPVFGGIILQFIVGFLVLRWSHGHDAFDFLSKKVVGFLDFTTHGTSFTYGFVAAPPNICGFGSVFIYTALQIIIYFGAIVSVLYYLGIIQFVLSGVATIMHFTIGTTAAESLNAAACIFLGQTEAAILIEPALSTMTASEIHAVMTAGFACIAGSLFSAYISFGACPTYLLSATVMSAAVSLAVSKLLYPEIQDSKQKTMATFKFRERTESNILECISNGAVHASTFVWAIGANLVVYIALLAFLNTTVGYLGDRVDIADLSFNKILGYCFFPLAYMMGASDKSGSEGVHETLKVAELMGMKTILNEFIAYQRLAQMIVDGTLTGARAQMIATYALCGFSNISMIGSQIGILSSMCPKRKATFAKLAVRALIAGCISCFMTACVAGILVDVPTSCRPSANANCLDITQLINVTALTS